MSGTQRAPLVLAVHPGAELFGSDRMFLESVIGLLDTGARVVVALPDQGPLVPHLRDAGASIVIVPMLVLRKALMKPSGWPRLARETFRGVGAAWRLIRRLRPDAVYVSTITAPLWPVVARARRVRAVSHIHEAEASGSKIVNAALYLPHFASDQILVNSEFSRLTIRSAFPRLAARAEIVLNGVVGPTTTSPPRPHVDDSLRLLYVGRLSPRKGPDLILRAARALNASGAAVGVDIVGAVFPGYEWFEAELRTIAAAPELEGRVRFHGFHADVWPFLQSSDALVVPSRLDEPFGNTAVEGILAHRPVIVSETSGLREAAGGYDTAFFVAPDDSDAIVDAVTRLTDSWEPVVAATATAAERAERRHSPEEYRRRVGRAVIRRQEDQDPATLSSV